MHTVDQGQPRSVSDESRWAGAGGGDAGRGGAMLSRSCSGPAGTLPVTHTPSMLLALPVSFPSSQLIFQSSSPTGTLLLALPRGVLSGLRGQPSLLHAQHEEASTVPSSPSSFSPTCTSSTKPFCILYIWCFCFVCVCLFARFVLLRPQATFHLAGEWILSESHL